MSAAAEPPHSDMALDHALALAALGLRVLPIKPGHKRPPMASWQHAATDQPDSIRNWYNGLYRTAGVGLALGPQPSGLNLFALDIDTHDPAANGWEDLADLEQRHGKLPDTWRSATGAGGGHLIYNAPTGVTVRNQQAAGNRIAPSIDVRGDGGQIVVAPTIHPDTARAYAWEHGYAPWEHPIADAPAWLLELVAEPDVATDLNPAPTATQTRPEPTSGTVFDLHRADWNWETELLNRGWTHCGNRDGDSYWARPGKDRRQGHSAVLHQPDGPLVIFTTEIDPTWTRAATRTRDGSGWAFGPFGFYAATQHAGDRRAATRTLHQHYGIPLPDDINLADLIAPDTTDTANEVDPDSELLNLLLDWQTFWATDHKIEEWLWEPVIAANRSTAIYAKGGAGKSLITLRMVIDIIHEGHDVLYLDYEMTPEDLADRLEEMGVDETTDLTLLHYAQLPSLPAFDTPEGGKAVRRLAELVHAELVIIDTFARAVEGDENDADTVRAFYRQTGLHLKADGRAFIRIDHAGKDATKGQRGTSAKNDDVDVVWELSLVDDGYKLTAKKRRMGWVPETVHLRRKDNPLRLERTDEREWPSGTAEIARILDELELPDDTSARAAAAALREHGHGGRNTLIRAAVRYRQQRTDLNYLIGAEPVDNSAESAPQPSGRGQPLTNPGAAPGAPTPEPEKLQVNPAPQETGRGGARSTDASGAQCAPLKGAHAPSVTTNPAIEALFGDD